MEKPTKTFWVGFKKKGSWKNLHWVQVTAQCDQDAWNKAKHLEGTTEESEYQPFGVSQDQDYPKNF